MKKEFALIYDRQLKYSSFFQHTYHVCLLFVKLFSQYLLSVCYVPDTVLRAGSTAGTRTAWFQPLRGTPIHINPVFIWIYNYIMCLSAMLEMSKV